MSENDSKTVRGAGKELGKAFLGFLSVSTDSARKGAARGLHFTADVVDGKAEIGSKIKAGVNACIARGEQIKQERRAKSLAKEQETEQYDELAGHPDLA